MSIASPFIGIRIPPKLVCEFFAVFSRFEFTMKEHGYVRKDSTDATPAWRGFAEEAAKHLVVPAGSTLETAINFLDSNAPQIQLANLNWEKRTLFGASKISRAIDSAHRVRNNLFHGGKHTSHSPDGHDENLVQYSLILLYACLEQNLFGFLSTYNENVF
jgi:hypothetical protein